MRPSVPGLVGPRVWVGSRAVLGVCGGV